MSVRNILFPVDFSKSSIAMAAYVERAAALFQARVTLLHVFDPDSHSGLEIYVRTPTEIADEHFEIARRELNGFLATRFPLSTSPRLLISGDPATQIAATAKDGFDAIVLPTHAGRFRRMLLGSTTAKVLDLADCPVVTGQHAEEIAPRPLAHREWVCAVGLGEDSERVLRYAINLGAEAGVQLRIIHAIAATDPQVSIQLDLAEQVQSEERRQVYRRIDELQHKIGSDLPVTVAVGPVKAALVEAARHAEADVLIIGRGPENSAQGRLRDLTYAMIRDAACPVFSV